MDDYLIKPIDLGQLGQALRGIAGAMGAAHMEPGLSDAGVISEGLRSLGDPAVVSELIALFMEDAKTRLVQAQEALDAGKGNEVAEAAHSLKGSARNLRAEQLAKACDALEKMAKSASMDVAEHQLGQVKSELGKVSTLLEQQRKPLG